MNCETNKIIKLIVFLRIPFISFTETVNRNRKRNLASVTQNPLLCTNYELISICCLNSEAGMISLFDINDLSIFCLYDQFHDDFYQSRLHLQNPRQTKPEDGLYDLNKKDSRSSILSRHIGFLCPRFDCRQINLTDSVFSNVLVAISLLLTSFQPIQLHQRNGIYVDKGYKVKP